MQSKTSYSALRNHFTRDIFGGRFGLAFRGITYVRNGTLRIRMNGFNFLRYRFSS